MSGTRTSRIHMLAVSFLLGSLLLLSCQPAQPAATPKPAEKAAEKAVRGGTLRIATTGEPGTLDPNVITATPPIWTAYDALIWQDKDLNATKEGLIKDWTVSPDGKSITFKLQEGVKFQDGTDFDAAAVKFNIDRMKDPANKSPYLSNYATVDSVEVVDSATVRFRLRQVDPLMIPQMGGQGGRMVSPAAVKKYGQDFGRNPVGTGAFQFVEWVPGDRIVFKRFEGYWRKDKDGNRLPYLDGVIYKTLPDPTVAVANLRTGLVDFYNAFPVEQLPILKGDANLTYSTRGASYINTGVNLNTKRPPFDNKALRQAVALAVDREGLAARWGEGAASQPFVLHPTHWGYDGKAGVYPARDLAKAKAKMAEAGYPAGGLKVKLQAQGEGAYKWLGEILQANLAEIGIEVEIETLASAAFNTKVRVEGNYQISTGNQGIGLSDPGYIFGLQYHGKGTRNYFGPYGNPKVDDLLDKARSIYDQKERTALYQQAANLIADDVPFIPLLVLNWFAGMTKKVRDFVHYPDNFERLERVWMAQ